MNTEIWQKSESNEWYTPPAIIETAREVMGTIDLDPASNAIAQEWIKAGAWFGLDDDGFNRPWFGKVWLNPPYGRKCKAKGILGADTWIFKAIAHYESGDVSECILLVSGDNEGVKQLRQCAPIFGLPKRRIRFIPPPDKPKTRKKDDGPPGSVLAYLGPDPDKFYRNFQKDFDLFTRYQSPA